VRQDELCLTIRQVLGLRGETIPADAADRTPEPSRLCGDVLLAEDNPVNQAVAQAMLETLGFGQHGQQRTRSGCQNSRGSFDLVLMDCQMPELDGFGATRKSALPSRAAGSI